MRVKRVLVSFGTRPEAIKLAPVILALRGDGQFECRVCITAQHRDMLDSVLTVFGIDSDYDLDLMTPDQQPGDVVSRGLPLLLEVLQSCSPDVVLVQGDTASTFVTAFAAFLKRIPVAHVEAGLRTFDKYRPFPEEMNRRLTSAISDFHFAPTERARRNLISEGIADDRIVITGNTVIDALLWVSRRHSNGTDGFWSDDRRMILVTTHRRESFGQPLERVCAALRTIALRRPDCLIVLPVHPNPSVRDTVVPRLSNLKNVKLIEPQSYEQFLVLMRHSYIILTDSGGIQEEAPSLGRPVLVLRDKTERPEGIEAGVAFLVGTDPDRIVAQTERLLTDEELYRSVVSRKNPYGDGRASQRIVRFLAKNV